MFDSNIMREQSKWWTLICRHYCASSSWLKWRKPAECKHSGKKWQSNYCVWSWLEGWDRLFSEGYQSISSPNGKWRQNGSHFESDYKCCSNCFKMSHSDSMKYSMNVERLTMMLCVFDCVHDNLPLMCMYNMYRTHHHRQSWHSTTPWCIGNITMYYWMWETEFVIQSFNTFNATAHI